MNLKKLDARISGSPRAAKKKLLAKFLILTNDNFIWLEATQKERSDEAIIEIPEQTGEAVRLFVCLTTGSRSI
jgi:hypothetical protein